MDDVTFGRNGPYGDSGVAIPGRSLMSMNPLFTLLLGNGVFVRNSKNNRYATITKTRQATGKVIGQRSDT